MDILGKNYFLITSGSLRVKELKKEKLKFISDSVLITSKGCYFNPLHPNISMHILHTVLYIFPKMPTWGICLTIKSFFDR